MLILTIPIYAANSTDKTSQNQLQSNNQSSSINSPIVKEAQEALEKFYDDATRELSKDTKILLIKVRKYNLEFRI